MLRHHGRWLHAVGLSLTVVAALFAGAAQAKTIPESPPPEPGDPIISIVTAPALVANIGIPGEHLHMKLDQPVGVPPIYTCLPAVPEYEIAFPIHVVFKPQTPTIASLFRDPPSLTDINDWISPGLMGIPLPRDQLGSYEQMVICAEAGEAGFKVGDASTAYSVEPYPYRDYVEADHPVAWWRLGDLPKGSTTLHDSAGSHDGIYYADGGVHPALDRDGAPNCNVESRATAGCNDGTFTGITSGLLSDEDRAVFFTPGQYAAVQDFPAITGAYTIEAWVNPHEVRDMMIFQHGHGPALYLHDGKFVFRQTETDVVQTSGDAATAGDWFHVVGTWDGTGTARLYVNGEEVGSSTDATAIPSGMGSTLYLGNGEYAGGETFNGSMDEVAYYDHSLSAGAIALHYTIGTYVQDGDQILSPLDYYMDVTRPKVVVNIPTEGAVFNAGKVPSPDYDYSDADGLLLDGVVGGDIVACIPGAMATSPGAHTFTVTCTDRGGNVKSVSHDYTVADFPAVVGNDHPIGYWRLGDAPDSSVMDGYGASPDGAYKNDTAGGPTGISGDADATRSFFGQGGYGYVNGIEHPRWSYTMEAWVALADSGDAMIMQHGHGGALFVKDGRIVFRQTVTDVTSTATAASLTGGFHQVVGTWDGVYARLYIDGDQQGDAVYAPTPPSGFSTFYVGYGEYGPWLRGDMDEVSYYATALSPWRIREHFYADPAPQQAHNQSSPAGALPAATLVAPSGSTKVTRTDGRLVATLPLTVRCPAGAHRGCRVTVALQRRSGKRALGAIGHSHRTLKAGARWRARVTLTPSAASDLRRRHALPVLARVSVRPVGRHATTHATRLTLRYR